MQVISTALGYVLPNIISKEATHHAATALYTIFGVRLLWIAWKASPQENNQVIVLSCKVCLYHKTSKCSSAAASQVQCCL